MLDCSVIRGVSPAPIMCWAQQQLRTPIFLLLQPSAPLLSCSSAQVHLLKRPVVGEPSPAPHQPPHQQHQQPQQTQPSQQPTQHPAAVLQQSPQPQELSSNGHGSGDVAGGLADRLQHSSSATSSAVSATFPQHLVSKVGEPCVDFCTSESTHLNCVQV